MEKKSALYFNDFFIKKFPKKYNNIFEVNVDIPLKNLKNDLQNYMHNNGYPLRDTLLEMMAVQYAVALSEKTNSHIKTIFSANVIDDPFPHCALQAMRSTTINVCENLNDWEWQITSPNIDKNISKSTFTKVDEIKFCYSNDIPIEKSISCYKPKFINNKIYHCGECLACMRRKKAFNDAKIEDKTLYFNNN